MHHAQKLNSGMDCECCCEQPIIKQKFFTAISLDAHNNNIRNPSQNSTSDHAAICCCVSPVPFIKLLRRRRLRNNDSFRLSVWLFRGTTYAHTTCMVRTAPGSVGRPARGFHVPCWCWGCTLPMWLWWKPMIVQIVVHFPTPRSLQSRVDAVLTPKTGYPTPPF